MAGQGASNPVNIFEYARNWSQKVPWGQPQNWANRLRRPRAPVEFHKNSEQDELILTDILAMCLAPENHAKFNFRVRWFAEIARYALGYVTQEEEDEYERSRQFVATRVAWRQNDYGKIATGLNYMLRHDRSLDRLMDNRAMIELMPLITEGTARMPSPFRIYPNAFFAIVHSDEKQRFHLVIRLDKNVWHNTGHQYDMPFSMRLGVNQGHTGLSYNISPEKLNHRLTSVAARCLGHVVHVTRKENWASVERYGLMRDHQSWNRRSRGEGRDYVHFMYSNPQTSPYIPLGPGTVVPRNYEQPLYVKLNVIRWLQAGRPLYFSNNGVVLAHYDVEPTYLDISASEPRPQDAPEPAKELRSPLPAEKMVEKVKREKEQQDNLRSLFNRLLKDKKYALEVIRRIDDNEPGMEQIKRHMSLWLDELTISAIARFFSSDNDPTREYNRSRLRSRQVMPEGHYQMPPGWSLIPPKEIDDRDPWSILGYNAPTLVINGDGATTRSLFMVHPLVLSKDQANLVKADEEVIRFDRIWKDITSRGSTARTSGGPQGDEEDDSAHAAEREMTWFIQNVNNLVLNPWMVYDIGMVSLHDRTGTRVLQSTGEDVILVRDWDRLTRHQREYFCRRYKLLRPSVYGTEEDPKTYAPSFEPGISQWMELAQTGYQQFFFIRAWENGRRWAEILTDHGIQSIELSSFLDMCRDPKLLGWNFGIPEPQWDNFGNTVEEAFNNPLFAKLHYRFKQEEEIGRVMHLVSERVCDFFIKVLPKWVLDHSILWEEFMILDPDTNLPAYKTSEAALQAEVNPEKYHTHFAMNFKKFRFSARVVWYLIDRDRNHLESFLHNSNSRFVQHACYQLREYVQARVAVSDPLYEMIKKEEFERQYNSKFLEAISCSRVVVEPVSSGTYEPSSKLNLKVLQNILKGVYKIQKNEELAREREEEEEQAAQNISNLLADDMELDFDDDDVPVWRSIVNKYREGDQVLQREAVKITHLFKDKKNNEKATEVFSSERTDFHETSEPLPRTMGENLVEDLLTKNVAERAFEAGEEVPPYTRVSTIAGGIYTGSMMLTKDEDMEEEAPEEDPAVEPEKDEEMFDENAGTFPSEGPKMEVDQEEAKEESTPHFLSREIGEDSAASYLPSGEKDANLEDTSGQRKSKKSRLNKIPDPHFHEEVQDDATLEEKKKAVKKIREVREDDGEKKLEAEIQESFPSEVVVDKDPVDANNTYELHTSPLRLLGELTGDPGIGFYQLCFRETHARLLNHVCFRKGEISHPHYQSRINEDDFVQSIRSVCPVPPPDCYEHDSEHDLKRFFINDDRISYLDGKYKVDPKSFERAEHAREELEDTKKELKKELESYGPNGPSWDFVTFYEELCRRFLKGRIEEQYGTNLLASSESLTFLSWNYGNMVRGQKYTTPRFLQGLDSAMRPRKQSAMSLQYEQFENNLFFNMLFFLRARVVILQEAHLLVPAKEFIEQKNWTVCFNDWENLAVMARLAPGGYVKIIAGHDQDLGHCEQRDVTWAIYEICFGKTRPRQEFKDADFEFDDYGPEDQRVPLTRANMHTIRVCNYHVDTHRAVDAHLLTGEQTALMLYECFVYEVDIISGDANSLAYRMSGYKRQPMANYYYSTMQHWIRRFSEARVKADPGIKAPIPRTFYSSTSLVLKQCEDYFDKLWEDYSTVEKEEYQGSQLGDTCLSTIVEWGHSMSEEEYENSTVSTKEFICNFSENFAMIDTEVMCSRPTDEDSHGPMFISLRPASSSSGDRRQYRMGATLHEAKLRRKERQKENKRKGRPPTSDQAASSTAAA